MGLEQSVNASGIYNKIKKNYHKFEGYKAPLGIFSAGLLSTFYGLQTENPSLFIPGMALTIVGEYSAIYRFVKNNPRTDVDTNKEQQSENPNFLSKIINILKTTNNY